MSQLSLFDERPQRLLDDASGRIVLIPELVAGEVAEPWFEQLQAGIAGKSGTRLIYEREVGVPRLHAHFRIDDPQLPATA